MSRSRHTFVRGCALLLLALAISPLTAPFSAGHPLDLFGDAAHVQTKKAPDEPLVSLPSVVPSFASEEVVPSDAAQLPTNGATGLIQLDLPLRL
jgi:hypothetical protein